MERWNAGASRSGGVMKSQESWSEEVEELMEWRSDGVVEWRRGGGGVQLHFCYVLGPLGSLYKRDRWDPFMKLWDC